MDILSGSRIRLQPPTRIWSASPARRARMASCKATEALEQAVSTDLLGPCKSKAYDTRADVRDGPVPVKRYL